VDPYGLDTCSAVDNLKEKPIPNEKPLPDSLIREIVDLGWKDITKDQDARDDAARDLKEKVFDENRKDDWVVNTISTVWDHRGTTYHGEIYQAYPYNSETGKGSPVPAREYFDINGDGRIDFTK
jgi:hypothetical protein